MDTVYSMSAQITFYNGYKGEVLKLCYIHCETFYTDKLPTVEAVIYNQASLKINTSNFTLSIFRNEIILFLTS